MPVKTRRPNRPNRPTADRPAAKRLVAKRLAAGTTLDTRTGIAHRTVRMAGNKCAPPPDNRAAVMRSLDTLTSPYDGIADASQSQRLPSATRRAAQAEITR